MNTIDDLDRALAQWLEEGAMAAPDWPIDQAIEHARSHPRRRDPLAFLRPDAMPSRRSGLVLQPAAGLLLVGLVLALAAVVVVGSQLRQPNVVPPSVDASASPTLSPSPIASPTTPAEPQPTTEPDFSVELTLVGGATNKIDILDASGLVSGAESGTPAEGVSFPSGTVEVENVDASTLRLGWSGGCEDIHVLSIDPTGRAMTLERPKCAGDAVAFDRILVLALAEPIAAGEVTVQLREGIGELLPAWRQFSGDAEGNLVWLDVWDRSASLLAVDQAQAEGSPVARDVILVGAMPGDPASLVLTWSGPACETRYSLIVHGGVGQLDLERETCAAGGEDINRSFSLTFSSLVDPEAITTVISDRAARPTE